MEVACFENPAMQQNFMPPQMQYTTGEFGQMACVVLCPVPNGQQCQAMPGMPQVINGQPMVPVQPALEDCSQQMHMMPRDHCVVPAPKEQHQQQPQFMQQLQPMLPQTPERTPEPQMRRLHMEPPRLPSQQMQQHPHPQQRQQEPMQQHQLHQPHPMQYAATEPPQQWQVQAHMHPNTLDSLIDSAVVLEDRAAIAASNSFAWSNKSAYLSSMYMGGGEVASGKGQHGAGQVPPMGGKAAGKANGKSGGRGREHVLDLQRNAVPRHQAGGEQRFPQPQWPSKEQYARSDDLNRQSQQQAGDGSPGGARGGGKGRHGRRGNRGAEGAGPGAPGGSMCKQRDMESMRCHLQALQLEDPATVFIARRINKLGFSSPEILRAHFSQYGEVKSIHISHSRVKSQPHNRVCADAEWRVRAAALGFVVMQSPEATSQILADGAEHRINGVTVMIQRFHRWAGEGARDALRDAPEELPEKTPCGEAEVDVLDFGGHPEILGA